MGPKGPMGPMGPKGPMGPMGSKGPNGPMGPKGPMGPIGPKGPKGPMGPKGPRRPHGAHGAGPVIGTPEIYTTTGLGLRKNKEMAGVDDLVVYMQTAVKYSSLYIQKLYIESVVFYSSLHIHHQIVHTSHFPIFSRPQPGGGVYL